MFDTCYSVGRRSSKNSDAGCTLVRVAETERKGFARNDITVPPSSDVAVLPPFFFEEPGRWLMVKGGSHDATNAGYPFHRLMGRGGPY